LKKISKLDLDIRIARGILDAYIIAIPVILPRKINLVCDATFFGKRSDRDGLLVFLDSLTGQVVWFKFIESETKANYQEGLNFLKLQGFEILSVTLDGKKGIKEVFTDYPVQICQFHIQQRVSKYLTQHPQTEAGQVLKEINDLFIQNRLTEKELGKTLAIYCKIYMYFLSERNDQNKYKHERIIKALRCYKRHLKNLFTFQKYPELNIPNTTNHVDGGVNTKVKDLVRNHRGMTRPRRNKLLMVLLNSLKRKIKSKK